MALTYETILNTDLGPLMTASKAWKRMGDRFDTLHGHYRDHVAKAASADAWRGASVIAYKGRGQVTLEEYAGARDEARAVASLLSEAHTELTTQRDRLVDLKEQAERACMLVTSHGHCSIDLMELERRGKKDKADHYREHPARLEADQQAHTDRIAAVVRKIRALDDNYRRALTARPSDGGKGVVDGFDGALHGDAASFNTDEAVRLARKGDDLTDTQLDRLNDVLALQRNNPEFAEKFATRMGAQGTLDFWGAMGPYDRDLSDDRKKLLARTREGLSGTLATATRSDSAAMRRWEREMTEAGPERQGKGRMTDQFGYQVMTDLMREGDYDDGFLHRYGDSLVEFEKSEAEQGRDPAELWTGAVKSNPVDGPVLADTDNAWGNDPMVGLMEGLSHSPGASTDFFSDQETFDYVVGGGEIFPARTWPEATTLTHGEAKGYGSLGHALEAAVTGVPAGGGMGQELHRGPEQVDVMHKVVDAYRSDLDLLDRQKGIGDSLGRMGAAYVDDLNYGLSDEMGTARAEGNDRLLGTDGHGFTSGQSIGFLRQLGSDEEAHRIMSTAQQAYTASRVYGLSCTDDVYRAAELGAQAHGALDEARAERFGHDSKADDEAENKKLTDAATLKKGAAGIVVYGATGALGGVASPAAPVLIPLATGTAGSAVTSGINAAIDADVKASGQDTTNESIKTIEDFDGRAKQNATAAIRQYMEEQQVDGAEQTSRRDALNAAYKRGRDVTDTSNTPER
ncbi:hypothetical protein [Streptomyces daliensis]|uniref:AG2 protein n=1 Tax=Streptomyces daliensis TaxID=299421 RepID=A0A8T4IGP3_9ACTN|nr:hypothetical protein [Streptomyces daliensis]